MLPQNPKSEILIVEDSAIQAEMLRRLLVREGYEAVVAKDGAQGLEAARKYKPAIILTDINMPVMDGYEMCSKIKQDVALRDIPLILLTQLYEPEEVLSGLESGADAYITKPYKEEYLLSMVKVTLENPHGFMNNPDQRFIEFDYHGKHYTVRSGRAQTLSFLISSYENSIMKNMELFMTQKQLKMLNETLDEKVKDRTAELEHEISERRAVEAKLRDSEEHYRTLFEQSPYGVVLIDPETLMPIEFNETAHTQLGYSREEFARLRMEDYEAVETPERIRTHIDKILIVLRDDFETRHRTKHGDIRNILVTAQTIELHGKAVLNYIFHDITERKKAEEELQKSEARLRIIIDENADAIIVTDINGVVLFANPAAGSLFGLDREQLMGEQFGLPLVTDEATEIDILRRHGEKAVAQMRMVKIEWKGEPAYLASLRDITESRRAQQQLKEYSEHLEDMVHERTQQLEAANKGLESFSYSVSHDLRAPLRAITGFSGILLEDYADKIDDEGKRLLNVVKNNVNKMGQLIDDILAFSRAGRKELEFTEIDMEKLAREVIEELQPTFAERKVQFEIKTLPPANGDRAALHQVFTNLISNAIKFTRGREPAVIEIGSIKQAIGNEGAVVYYVKDNGAGFDMENADKLFGVFQRLHSTEEFEGTGIGLSIVKAFITKHSGRVWAEGKVGEGATFYFTLPNLSARV